MKLLMAMVTISPTNGHVFILKCQLGASVHVYLHMAEPEVSQKSNERVFIHIFWNDLNVDRECCKQIIKVNFVLFFIDPVNFQTLFIPILLLAPKILLFPVF